MKILLVDLYEGHGHDQFNSIQIRALKECGYTLDLLGFEEHFLADDYNGIHEIFVLPKELETTDKNLYKSIFYSLKTDFYKYKYLNNLIRVSNYDSIILLRYDLLSILCLRTNIKVYIFDHWIAGELNKFCKYLIVLLYPKNYIHVALNEDIKLYMEQKLPSKSVVHVPHGYLSAFENVGECSYALNSDKIVFVSATSSCNKKLLNKIIHSVIINEYLCKNRIKLLIKTKDKYESNPNCAFVSGYISDLDYKYLITNSIVVFLPYDDSFVQRASGIMFECVANNTPVIATKIPTFETYCTIENTALRLICKDSDFIDALDYFLHNKTSWNKSLYNPRKYWQIIFND